MKGNSLLSETSVDVEEDATIKFERVSTDSGLFSPDSDVSFSFSPDHVPSTDVDKVKLKSIL